MRSPARIQVPVAFHRLDHIGRFGMNSFEHDAEYTSESEIKDFFTVTFNSHDQEYPSQAPSNQFTPRTIKFGY
jgi:hypothetical protein